MTGVHAIEVAVRAIFVIIFLDANRLFSGLMLKPGASTAKPGLEFFSHARSGTRFRVRVHVRVRVREHLGPEQAWKNIRSRASWWFNGERYCYP